MDAIKAILARHSVRMFNPKPVPKDIVVKIFEASLRSPSGGNAQPWEVFVAAGSVIERIRKTYQERFQSASAGPPRGPGGPPPQPPYIQERMAVIRNERMKLLGLDPNDPAASRVFMEWASKLNGAQVIAIICMDKTLSSNLDLGLFIQTVCIAAQGYGVDTFIAGSLVSHHDVLRKELEIPDNLNIITGIALGYPDPKSIINTYRSPRRPVTDVLRYKE
jgi:nitroreductase